MLDLTDMIHAIAAECTQDRVSDDVTAQLLGVEGKQAGVGWVRARQVGVFSGISIVQGFQSAFVDKVQFRLLVSEGQRLDAQQTLVEIRSTVGQCLSIERTLVNYLSHLCGVATLTRKFVDEVSPYPTKILATRKTLPGLRDLQLEAVVAGGGAIHRRSLSDGILIKENHQIFVKGATLLERAKVQRSPLHKIEIEIQDLKMLKEVLLQSPDVIMLDNLPISDLKLAIQEIRAVMGDRCGIEVSGGMTLERVREIAALGVNYISVGQLTHSAPSLNLSMDVERE